MKIKADKIIFLLALTFVAYTQGPRAFRNWSLQGTEAEIGKGWLNLNDLKPLAANPPLAYVFWATWCKPCSVELSRIQALVESGKIDREKIIAVATDDSIEEVKKAAAERKYSFPVVWDQNHTLSSRYQVEVTPTLVVVGFDNKIEWITSGLSPTLELRLAHYLPSEKE